MADALHDLYQEFINTQTSQVYDFFCFRKFTGQALWFFYLGMASVRVLSIHTILQYFSSLDGAYC
jgi:hypothetical protein